jgi:acyl-CoA synthetase (AMP-forming)/AMP-acid ligase II/thioesterase domain-containing protein/acyl carrier protein
MLPEAQPQACDAALSVYGLISAQAGLSPDAGAICAPGRKHLTYGRLLSHVQGVVGALNAMGVGRNDRVAVVLPNGPEMASAFVAVTAGASCAPLNPAYQDVEFAHYFSDLRPRAVIVQAGAKSPAAEVARARGIAIIELLTSPGAEAGVFALHGPSDAGPGAAGPGIAGPYDEALALHTSGTTFRPKIVSLTQADICVSARNICMSLALTPADRCLNVMPLFHVHGLIASVLATLASGGSVVCTTGFDADLFPEWLKATGSTWYTAVPAMHQAILSRSSGGGRPPRGALRFVRSSSSALPPRVMAQLEATFGVPVIEAYGMTEAAHQIATNPLPPGVRKPGSVGTAAGPEVGIMDDAGALLLPGERGEIAIRGASVIRAYDNNPAANAASFANGWFRTGDQGFMDAQGYIYITGRIKEIINRGGEKVSPREVDEVLLDHPAVEQAATFAVPHAVLGEDVVAAVVLRKGASATEADVRGFAATRLTALKLPRRVLIVDEIPKGPTGKVQRIGLAERLADRMRVEFVAPRDEAEMIVAGIWAELLKVERVGANDNFFMLGGTSLLAAEAVSRVQASFRVALPLDAVFREPTVAGLASMIRERLRAGDRHAPEDWPCVVPIQCNGSRMPFIMVDMDFGWNAVELAPYLGPERPVYGLRPPVELRGESRRMETRALADLLITELRAVLPKGPYVLAGGCAAGVVAFEIAQRLRAQGESVPLLVLCDVNYPPPPALPAPLHRFLVQLPRTMAKLRKLDRRQQLAYALERSKVWAGRALRALIARAGHRRRDSFDGKPAAGLGRQLKGLPGTWRGGVWRYWPRPYPGRMVLLLAADTVFWPYRDRRLCWRRLAAGPCEVHIVPGAHQDSLREPHVRFAADKLKACLDDADGAGSEQSA